MYKPQYPGLYYFDNFTFTSLGASGHRGPDPTKGYIDAPWRDGDFSIQKGQQYWTVPTNGTYQITAAGAYGASPGRVVSGQLKLGEGQQLRMLVGQRPSNTYAGGATWVSTEGTLLMVASGGDGIGGTEGSFGPYGNGQGQDGAGYLTDGLLSNVTYQFLKPKAYVNGGFGNYSADNTVEAGFGGGNLVGGGGYTGSPGDGVSGATCYADASVTGFTDLGATSNHIGYVTVSLIDPAPIDLQIWSWDDESPWDNLDSFQSNVYTITWSESLGVFVTSGVQAGVCISSKDAKKWSNHAIPWPYSYSKMVSANDKPILVLGRNTSNDGVTWYLNDIPWSPYYASDPTNTVYVNNMFISTIAPGYYTPFNGIYTSTDGYKWTFITSELIDVKAYGNSMYLGTDSYGQLFYSSDLVTWNYVYAAIYGFTFNVHVYDVTFANNKFVGFGNGGSFISADGISWGVYIYNFYIEYNTKRQILFGNDLFMVVSAGYVYTSPDGINWTFTKSFDDYNISVAYSPSKKFFMFVPDNGLPIATLDGKYFTSLSEQLKAPIRTCAYSKGLDVLVALAKQYTGSYYSSPIYIYTSSDNGETLSETAILNNTGYTYTYNLVILWSDEFYSFFIYGTTEQGVFIFTSNDGMTWVRQNDYVPDIPMYNLQNFSPVWYKEKNRFEYKSYSLFYSSDGINWSRESNTEPSPSVDLGSKAWSPELRLFVGTSIFYGISSHFEVYVSSDDINWTLVYATTMFTVGFAGVAWSPELGKFYIYAAGYPTESNSLYLFSSENGYDWNRRVVPKVYTLDYANGFYWFSGLDRFIVQSYQNFKGLTFSAKALKQF